MYYAALQAAPDCDPPSTCQRTHDMIEYGLLSGASLSGLPASLASAFDDKLWWFVAAAAIVVLFLLLRPRK